jgi:hypothetical protein
MRDDLENEELDYITVQSLFKNIKTSLKKLEQANYRSDKKETE